jgi:outer membrane lipoprotein-sorting protein
MKSPILLLTAVLLAASAGVAEAQLTQPKVSFSATRVMNGNGVQMQGKYYYAPNKYRNDMEINGQNMTTIFRQDLDRVWNIMPAQKMYMEVPVGKFLEQGGATLEGSEFLEQEAEGNETINGYRTTKYRVSVRDALGGTSSGFVWVTADMIPVKVDMTTQGGNQVTIELSDIEVGPQPDEVFDVPDGYQKLSLGNLGGLAGAAGRSGPSSNGTGSAAGAGADSEGGGFAGEVAQEAEKGAEEGAKEAVKDGVKEKVKGRLRGLFKK